MVGTLIPWIAGILSGLIGTLTALKGMKFVKEDERALKLWLDKAVEKNGVDDMDKYVVINPGFKLIVPLANRLERIDMKLRSLIVPQQSVTLQNGDVYVLGASILCRVKPDYTSRDLYNAAYGAKPDVELALIEFCKLTISKLFTGRESENPPAEEEIIVQELTEIIQARASALGMTIIGEGLGVGLVDFRPSDKTIDRWTTRETNETTERVVGPIAAAFTANREDTRPHTTNGHSVLPFEKGIHSR